MRKMVLLFGLATAAFLPAKAQSSQEAISIDNAIQEISKLTPAGDPASYNKTASFPSFHGDKDSTRGSRLLFYNWPKGYVIGVYDTLLKNDRLFLNYDKISHVLYFTFDGKTIIKVETSQAREIHFTDGNKQTTLIRVDGIDPKFFFEPLSDSTDVNHYALYRQLRTRFHRANYQTDGLISTGNNYDEYVDEYEYFIVMPGGKLYTPVNLKKKAIRDALASAGPNLDAWFSQHKKDEINEAFLKGLVDRLNN
jgi:hypothetical protein